MTGLQWREGGGGREGSIGCREIGMTVLAGVSTQVDEVRILAFCLKRTRLGTARVTLSLELVVTGNK